MSYRDFRRIQYAVDMGARARRKNQAAKAQGRDRRDREFKDSYSRTEMVEILGVNRRTFFRYVQLGVIPKTTYPSGLNHPRYWRHQAVLLTKLFNAMRKDGWPTRMPHFVGSPYWTQFLAALRSEWEREPHAVSEWKARCGDHHETGKDSLGECASV